jgi:uncharacterized membrane protein YphA (DoxX/SURF4 family)
MNLIIWVVQIVLAVAFIGAGFGHATQRDKPRPGMEWMLAVPKPLMTTIGVLEIAGGIGLVVPMATGIVPVLTPLAAIALALLMVLAAAFHLRRGGEQQGVLLNIVLGLMAFFVAYGTLGVGTHRVLAP